MAQRKGHENGSKAPAAAAVADSPRVTPIHVLTMGDVRDGETIMQADVVGLSAFRVKTKTGRYAIVLAPSAEAVELWMASPEQSEALDRISALESELATLKQAYAFKAAR